jgi:hypothetical protein
MRLLLLFLLAVPAGGLPAQQAAALKKAAETITSADVMRRIQVIAADSMMGRAAPSRGLELTAHYVADQFKRFGLKPGGDNGGWIQRYLSVNTYDLHVPRPEVPNVAGILEGSDPQLKHEYIVMFAHMDHLGTGGGGPDTIFNGADDNASGTAGILELAEAFRQPGMRPRRSLLFLTVSAQERRAGYSMDRFVEHLRKYRGVQFPQLVANFNFEMIGRWLSDTVLVIGLAYSDLGATFARVQASHPELRLAAMPNPVPARLHDGADHRDFLTSRGVPVLKFGGPNAGSRDYHMVTDSPEKIEAERAARILRLAFYVVHEVANAEGRPQWDPESYKAIARYR